MFQYSIFLSWLASPAVGWLAFDFAFLLISAKIENATQSAAAICLKNFECIYEEF